MKRPSDYLKVVSLMLTGIPSERRGHGLIVTLVCIARWIVCFTLGLKWRHLEISPSDDKL